MTPHGSPQSRGGVGPRGWWRDVALVMVIAFVAERILHEAVGAVNLPSGLSGWADALALVLILGPLLSWILHRRALEAKLAVRHGSLETLPRSPHRSVRIAVLASLAVLVSMSLLALALERGSLRSAGAAAELVNEAGRQRYLSQVIARLAPLSVTDASAQLALREAIERFSRAVATSDSLRAEWLGAPAVSDYSAEASRARAAFIALMAAPPRDATEAQALAAAADRFLGPQDRYVARIGALTRGELEHLGEAQGRFAWAILVLFIGIALVVVEPAVRLLERQHRANGAMGREYERLALVAQRTSNAVVMTSPARQITWVNAAFTELTGFSLDEAQGKSPGTLLQGPGTDPATIAQVREALDAERSVRTVLLNYAKDGTQYWLDMSIEPLRDASGTLTGFMSVESDVTRLIETQQALERERAELHRLAAQAEEAQRVARIGNWEYDLETGSVDWSLGIHLLFGRDPALGPPTFEEMLAGYAPQGADELRAAIATTAASGEPYSLILRTASSNPDVRFVRGIGHVRRGPEGRATALYGTVADLTAPVELQAQLETARRSAEAASLSKSEFLANMSHEIRTPLTVIMGFADVLRDRALLSPDGAAQLETIATIQRAGEHLIRVINDILDISKIEAGRMEVERVDTDVSALFRDVESLIRPRALGKGIDLTLAVLTPLPAQILTDPTRLRQILMNLVGNAVKFTETGGVTLDVSVVGSDAARLFVVGVEDSGIGMTPEQASALFVPFSQADTSVTRRFGGTGLGLTISRRLAALMGGTVELVRSAPGRGSRFELRLPLQPGEDGGEISEFSSAVSQSLSAAIALDALAGRRVLLAEDGPDNQVLISLLLESVGATVVLAANGRIALDIASQTEPPGAAFDLVLTDMQMPEMDGYTLARQLRARGSDVPIIALTANAMAEDRARCLDAGCSDYATKPIDRAVLVQTCARWATTHARGQLEHRLPQKMVSAHAGHRLLGKLSRDFAEALPARVRTITERLSSNDAAAAQSLAHQLRGAGGSFGFPLISTVAGALEDALIAGDGAAAARAVSDLAALAEAAERGL